MIACADVAYGEKDAVAACVVFRDWHDERAVAEVVERMAIPGEYVSGEFFRRELPCLMNLISQMEAPLHSVIVDGYVWLDRSGRPGLGAHLYRALGNLTTVIGVAKNPFKNPTPAITICRGLSARALYVSAVGMEPDEAARRIRNMQGPFRIPELLKRVDRLSRTSLTEIHP